LPLQRVAKYSSYEIHAAKFVLKKEFKIYTDELKNISGDVPNNSLDGFIINVPTSSEVRSLICAIQSINYERNKSYFVHVSFEGIETLVNLWKT